jgi:hypothetical protein
MPSIKASCALSLLIACSIATAARADDQTMRTFYPSPGASSSSSPSQSVPSYVYGSPAYNSPSYNTQGYNAPSYNPGPNPYSNNNGAPANILGPGHHLPGAMPNPAYVQQDAGPNARTAERERLIENMRKAGYSEERIKAASGYMGYQEDPPGTKYKMMGGLKVRDDGMTPEQALHNITTNGLMNTPISTDRNYYAPGSYGYYKTHGGTSNFDQWMHGQR